MYLSILIATVPPRKKYLNRLLTNLQKQIVENNLEDKIEVVIFEDDFENVVGHKFNKLVDSAKGRYCVLIGDDDILSDDYCISIIKAIDENPNVDQISHNHRYYHNNDNKFIRIKVSKEYEGESIVFFNFLKCYVQKYYKNRNQDWELRLNVHQLISVFEEKERTILRVKNNSLKMFIILFIIKLLKKYITLNLRHTCHTTPIKKEIFEKVKFSDLPREQDLEWATKVYQMGLIKTEYKIEKDLYYYYYNHDMSINRGKSGRMSIEEKRKKLTETLNTIKDFEWELQSIDKINIRWIQ